MPTEIDDSNSSDDSPRYRDKSWLREKHHNEGLSPHTIGDIEGVSHHTIRKWLKKNGLEIRKKGYHTYKSEEWLYDQYWNQGKSLDEVAEASDTDRNTVAQYMEQFGIDRRGVGGCPPDAPYTDPEWLFEKYHIDCLNCDEMGDLVDRSAYSIRYHMDANDIDRIPMGPKTSEPFLNTNLQGYVEICHTYQGEEYRVKHSRLLAVSEFGLDAVRGMDVHHPHRIKWDWPGNIELLSKSDHGQLHANDYWNSGEK
jgi:DNA-binding CsgD family transcriptional regulator